MKQILLVVCSVMLALSLTACGVDGRASLEETPSISGSSSIATSSEEMASRNVPSSEPAFKEDEATSKAPPSISKASSAHSVATPLETIPEPAVPVPELTAPASTPESSTPEPTAPEPITPEPITPELTAPELTAPEEETMRSIKITAGGKTFSATLAENDAANSFAQLLQGAPVAMQMSDYSGFEKVGSLGTTLPESNRQITAQAGDIILYNGNQICVFYGSNSWSYTRLGRIDDLSGWAEALGGGDVTVTFSVK